MRVATADVTWLDRLRHLCHKRGHMWHVLLPVLPVPVPTCQCQRINISQSSVVRCTKLTTHFPPPFTFRFQPAPTSMLLLATAFALFAGSAVQAATINVDVGASGLTYSPSRV